VSGGLQMHTVYAKVSFASTYIHTYVCTIGIYIPASISLDVAVA